MNRVQSLICVHPRLSAVSDKPIRREIAARGLQGVGSDGLVERLAAAKAEAAIKADGSIVLGGYLQEGTVHAEAAKAVQGLKQECGSQAAAAMSRQHAQV